MNTVWSTRIGSKLGNPLAQLHRCLPPVAPIDAEACTGFLSGAWNLRLLLLELGSASAEPNGPWPAAWFEAATGPVIAGLRLQAERWRPESADLAELEERLDGVGAICLWLGDQCQDPDSAKGIIELAQAASALGLSVLAAGPGCARSDRTAKLVDFAQVRDRYLAGLTVPKTTALVPEIDLLPVSATNAASPLNQLLVDLPSDQRFQARVAVLSALAWDLQQSGRALHGLERRAALNLGETLRLSLAETTTEEWANDTIALLIGAIRAKNTMDTRLRNMANDRLGLLMLLATARLGLRCRSFTVRDICRELGAVATGT